MSPPAVCLMALPVIALAQPDAPAPKPRTLAEVPGVWMERLATVSRGSGPTVVYEQAGEYVTIVVRPVPQGR